MVDKKLSKDEKIVLLKNYLVEDVFVNAIVETLSDEKLDEWINTNLDTMLICGRIQ